MSKILNKYQKAFKNIHSDLERLALSDKPDTTLEDYENISHLVDKETPMKPEWSKENQCYNCSECYAAEIESRYCHRCGQRQDWSDQHE